MSHLTNPNAQTADLIARLFAGARKLIIDPSMVLIDELPDDLFELMAIYMPVDEVESIGASLSDDGSIMFHVDNFEFELIWHLDLPDADVLTA